MFDPKTTRVILDGQILEDVSGINISLNIKDKIPCVICLKNGETKEANLLNVDVVPENLHDNTKETLSWAQFICHRE